MRNKPVITKDPDTAAYERFLYDEKQQAKIVEIEGANRFMLVIFRIDDSRYIISGSVDQFNDISLILSGSRPHNVEHRERIPERCFADGIGWHMISYISLGRACKWLKEAGHQVMIYDLGVDKVIDL